jgi:hypothetical protein
METQRRWIWRISILLAVVALVAIFVFRANPPKERAEIQREKVAYTTGTFVSGPLTVEAGGFLNFRFILNGKKRLNGKFTTVGYKGNVDCMVLDEKNFELFKNRQEFQRRVGTGSIPGGKIDRVFEPGTYYLVFNNLAGRKKIDLAEADFSIE